MRPSTVRLAYSVLAKLVFVYLIVVTYIFATVEIEESKIAFFEELEGRNAGFYQRLRRGAASLEETLKGELDALRHAGHDGTVAADAADAAPPAPECPLPPGDGGNQSRPPPDPYILRVGDPKYLPAKKPPSEKCLRWRNAGGYWEHTYSMAKLFKFEGMALDANKFHVSPGGERPEDVRGRAEEDELFRADPCGVILPHRPQVYSPWYQQKLIDASGVGVPDQSRCDVYLPGLTLLYERAEYANLFHTMNDWFNVHWSMEKLKYAGGELRVIWLDGHAAGNLDEVWADIFHANVTYVSQYEGIVCMETAAWLPKYSPIYDVDRTGEYYGGYGELEGECNVMDRFVERVLTAYDVPRAGREPTLDLVIDRQPYFAHPRVDMDRAAKDQRTLPNLQTLFPSARVLRLHEMSFKEQVETVANAKILRGVHGAGLTHLMWLPDAAEVVEWKPDDYESIELFRNLATWRPGIKYSATRMPKERKGFVRWIVDFFVGRGDDGQ